LTADDADDADEKRDKRLVARYAIRAIQGIRGQKVSMKRDDIIVSLKFVLVLLFE
jgi:hypothetical protein